MKPLDDDTRFFYDCKNIDFDDFLYKNIEKTAIKCNFNDKDFFQNWEKKYCGEQMNLFAEKEIEKMKKASQKTESLQTDIHSLTSALTMISNTFKNKWTSTNLYFYRQFDNKKFCFQHIASIPEITLSVLNKSSVKLVSYFGGDRKLYDGWDEIPDNDTFANYKLRTSQKTSFYTQLRNVNEILMWNWGFSITTVDDMNLMASLDYATDYKTNEVHNIPWQHILIQGVADDAVFMEPTFIWRNKEETNV